jgi:undecaprenyl-diphosphatase
MNSTAKSSRIAGTLAWMDHFELRMCRSFNALVQRAGACRVFQVASRLGDGVMWYSLIAALAVLGGRHGALVALQMALSGLSGLLLYRFLKHRLVRERPFITHASIKLAGRPLDRFSFPSGHTLHAVAFTVIACAGFPWLAMLLIPAALLIALSRVVLGLHYPSDVLAGALIGLGVASTTLALLHAA